MNAFLAVTVINLGIIALTGWIFYLTDSWWTLLILFFMAHTSNKE